MSDIEIVPVEPFPETIVDDVSSELRQAETMAAYIGRLNNDYRDTRLVRFMSAIAHSVALPSDSWPVNGEESVNMTFFRSSLLGMRFIANCVEEIDVLTTVLPPGVTDPNQPGSRDPHNTAHQLLALGRSGYTMLIDIIDIDASNEWISAIYIDPDRQQYIESGIGFPMLLLAALIRRNEGISVKEQEVAAAVADLDAMLELAAGANSGVGDIIEQLSD